MAKILALLLVVSVVTVVIVAIRVYGDQKVIAFGTAMSFIAASGAAFAAWRYLEKTAEVVQVTARRIE